MDTVDKAAFLYHNAPIRDAKLLPIQPALQPVGRRDELSQAHVALKAGRSILLYGRPGTGRSTLAAVLAAANIATNPGGALWFSLTEDVLDDLLARVARAYGLIALPDNPEKRRDAVRSLLEKRRPLIIFDGIADIDAIRDFAARIAATTPLIVIAEEAADGPWLPVRLGPLPANAAPTLLRTLGGVKDPADGPALEALAGRLGNDPLAVTLAGRLLAMTRRSPSDLLSALPATTHSGPQPAMIMTAFRALPLDAQGMLLLLAALPSDSAGAELLSEVSGLPFTRITGSLQTLEGHGFVTLSREYGLTRYHIHESVQAFLRGFLRTNQRLDSMEDRVIQGVLRYADRHTTELTADHDKLAFEMDNFVGAAATATDRGQEASVSKLIRILSTQTGDFIVLRGFQTELGQLMALERLLAAQPGSSPDWNFADIGQEVAPAEPATPGPAAANAPPVGLPEELPTPFQIPETHPEGTADLAPSSLEPALVVAAQSEVPGAVPETTLSQPADVPEPAKSATPAVTDGVDAAPPMIEQTFGGPRPAAPIPPEPPRPFFTRRDNAPTPPATVLPIPPVEQAPADDPTIQGLSIEALQKWIPKIDDQRLLGRYYNALAEKVVSAGGLDAATPHYLSAARAFNTAGDKALGATVMQRLGSSFVAAGRPADAAPAFRTALHLAYQTPDTNLQHALCFALGQQLLDDQRTLRQAESLLSEATGGASDGSDADRLLRRARQRIDRLKASGVVIPAALPNTDYAAQNALY